jgi:hypothetical protein
MTAVRVVRAVMTVAHVLALIVRHPVVLVVPLWLAMPRQQTVATNPLRPLVPMQTNPPLSASAR